MILSIISLSFILFNMSILAEERDNLYINKIVSVLYDDSGSMHMRNSTNWAYANYSLQAFTGLLNETDQLYVTFMSNWNVSHRIDMEDRQKSIDEIRNHPGTGPTPLSSMETAFQQLLKVHDSNPRTQYWLFVITDGQFQDDSGTPLDISKVDSILNDYVKTPMPNDSELRITYLAIGDTDRLFTPANDPGNNIFVYSANSDREIVSVISRMADQVSGRVRIDANDIYQLDNRKISFESSIPIMNIAMLLQSSEAELRSFTVENTGRMNIENSFSLRYPKIANRITDKTLFGSAILINNKRQNIPAGNYVLEFNRDIDVKSIDIMYEPALEMRMKLYFEDGNEITDVNKLRAGDRIVAKSRIYEIGTDKEINPDLLNISITYYMAYYENEKKVFEDSTEGLTIKDIVLKETPTKILSSMVIEGFQPLINTVEFTPIHPVIYSMEVIEQEEKDINRSKLYKNKKGVQFIILADGVQLTKTDVENKNYKFFLDDRFKDRLNIETSIESNGIITVSPIYDCWSFIFGKRFWNWSSTWLVPTGEMTITGQLSEVDLASGRLNIVREGLIITLINILFPFLLLFCFLGWIFKKRFKRGAKIAYHSAHARGDYMLSRDSNWSMRKLKNLPWGIVPFVRNRKRIGGVTFYACDNGTIGVKPQKVGILSRVINGRYINEREVINASLGGMRRPFVDQDKIKRKSQPMEIISDNDILVEMSNEQSSKFFKYLGG